MLDGFAPRQIYTKRALDKNLSLASPSFIETYKIVARPDLTHASANVVNDGSGNDTSEVYEIRCKDYKHYFFSGEYTANQTALSVIAAPGAGKQIVLNYVAQRSSANSGVSYLNSGAMKFGNMYFSAQNSLGAVSVEVECGDNTAVTLTTTTGSSPFYIALMYHIEEV